MQKSDKTDKPLSWDVCIIIYTRQTNKPKFVGLMLAKAEVQKSRKKQVVGGLSRHWIPSNWYFLLNALLNYHAENEQYCKKIQMYTYSKSSALSLTKTQN